jgi:hypothetical protein
VWALYGKVSVHPDVSERLMLVRGCERVGELPGEAWIQSFDHVLQRRRCNNLQHNN